MNCDKHYNTYIEYAIDLHLKCTENETTQNCEPKVAYVH